MLIYDFEGLVILKHDCTFARLALRLSRSFSCSIASYVSWAQFDFDDSLLIEDLFSGLRYSSGSERGTHRPFWIWCRMYPSQLPKHHTY